MNHRKIRAAAIAATVFLLAGGLTAGSADAATPRVPRERSGLRWASGVYYPGQTPAGHTVFGTWRKAKNDVAMLFSGRETWHAIISPTWLYDAWQNTPETLVISSAPFPERKAYSLAACAKGDYDAQWRTFGTGIADAGLASRTIVRLAWEFNGDWQQWAAYKPALFVACWRHIFTAAESTAPALRWDWTVNRGDSGVIADPRKAWPGKKYVDIVGIDSYDGWPPATGAAGWKNHYAGAYGLKFWAAFARSKGKRLSVPEWGLYPGSAWKGHNGGDNPYYIKKMFAFFAEQDGNLAYEAYFNDPDPAHLSALTLNPKGGAEYKRQIVKARDPG